MKSVSHLLYNLTLFSVISCCCNNQSFGQEKINISVGMGIPELLNVGVRYQLKQAEIGISVGTMPISGEQIISVSGDAYLHFGELSKFSTRRPWYGRIGLNYMRDEGDTFIDKYTYFNVRIGRDCNISKKFGIQIDIGTIFELSSDHTDKTPSQGWDLEIDTPILPSIGIGFFYRIYKE